MLQEQFASLWAYVAAFFSNPVLWYVVGGAVGWEALRWLLIRRKAPVLNEEQFANRIATALIFVVVLAWGALTYRLYWMTMEGWHGFAVWIAQLIFTGLAAAAIGGLLYAMKARKLS